MTPTSGAVPLASLPMPSGGMQAIMPSEALAALTGMVMECLQAIAVEVQTYQPWFAPQGHSCGPTIGAPASRGGTWEDEVNAMLLGTGPSVQRPQTTQAPLATAGRARSLDVPLCSGSATLSMR